MTRLLIEIDGMPDNYKITKHAKVKIQQAIEKIATADYVEQLNIKAITEQEIEEESP